MSLHASLAVLSPGIRDGPPGSSNKVTQLVEQLGGRSSRANCSKTLELAQVGYVACLRMMLDRLPRQLTCDKFLFHEHSTRLRKSRVFTQTDVGAPP